MNNSLEVIILMGVPGAGKSSLTHEIPGNYTIINQDSIGNRKDCEMAMKRALSQGKSVIIDRTNINRSQRKYFLDISKDYGAINYCIFLDFPPLECIERIKNRKVHETLPSSTKEEKIIEVVNKFNKTLELPDYNENFTEIYHITNVNELQEFPAIFKNRNKGKETA